MAKYNIDDLLNELGVQGSGDQPPATPKHRVDQAEQMFRMLEHDRVDLALYTLADGQALVRQLGLSQVHAIVPAWIAAVPTSSPQPRPPAIQENGASSQNSTGPGWFHPNWL